MVSMQTMIAPSGAVRGAAAGARLGAFSVGLLQQRRLGTPLRLTQPLAALNANNSADSSGAAFADAKRALHASSVPQDKVACAAVTAAINPDLDERQRLELLAQAARDEEDEGVPEELEPAAPAVAVADPALLLRNQGLSDETATALESRGIFALFPIQKEVFEPAMAGRDIVARSRTGSGKTLAFALPIIEKVLAVNQANGATSGRGAPRRRPQCIVLAPTRELASQVHREISNTAPNLWVGCYYGGSPYPAQERELRRGVDIVVGTPGRVIDLIDRNMLDLSEVRFAVLDEADQMLNVGFEKDVEQILSSAPSEGRQTLLFSATMPRWVKDLTRRFQNNPLTVDLVGDEQTGKLAESIHAMAVQVTPESRRSVLVDLLTVYGVRPEGGGLGKSIVFTQTKREADEVAAAVAQSLGCEALHGDISQAVREKVLARFRAGKFSVLVATDVAARGLDIPDVDLVVHYELPQEPEAFLHRSGRTGRAGKKGTTVAMYIRKEIGYLKRIMRETETQDIQFVAPPDPKAVMHASALQVVQRLQRVEPDVQKFFLPAARLIMQGEQPELRLAAALAALSGRTEVPSPRSLITQEEGLVTLRLAAERGNIDTVGQVLGIVRKLLPEGALDGVTIGRVRLMTDDAGRDAAAFDLPQQQAALLLATAEDAVKRGLVLDKLVSLPPEEDMNSSSGGGRGGGRGRGGRGGGYGGRGGAGRGSYEGRSSSSRGGGYSGDRRGGYSGGYGGGRGGGGGGYSGDRRSGGGRGGGSRSSYGSGGSRSYGGGGGGYGGDDGGYGGSSGGWGRADNW